MTSPSSSNLNPSSLPNPLAPETKEAKAQKGMATAPPLSLSGFKR
jgi:hypothetical protein